VDILLNRLIRGAIEDVWASVTESERTARWFGRWEGDAGPGAMIRLQMAFEEGDSWTDVRIDSCEPPNHLAVTTTGEAGGWHLEIHLEAKGADTALTFTQHRENTDGAGEIGPGWEYYLDNLLASREGSPLPDFGDYYPSMQGYYEGQAAAASADGQNRGK
jgi:uncharacterized protein YndB with AHSA1/START domain